MRPALIFAATALASASGLAQKPAAAPPPETKALVESCSAHKFETTVEVNADGKVHSSKVKLCGKEGQTDADWATTLKDAAKKVAANEAMPPAVKEQIVTALNAEIANIEAAMAAATAPPVAPAPPAARPPEYSTLPPLPTAPAVATRPSLPVAALARPRLTIECFVPAEMGGGGPCMSLERETLLIVRADQDLGGGTRLRFLRRGDVRGELTLAQMRQGQSLRYNLPSELCSGVVSSKVEIQILGPGASQAADTLGPYQLHC
jgi:hypothetical protein